MKNRLLFRPSIKNIVTIVVFSALNIGMFYVSNVLKLPFWLDTIGTMASAVSLGPVAGMLTAAGSSVTVSLIYGNSLIYYTVAAAVAVVIGLLVRADQHYDKLYLVSSALLSGLISTLICIPLNLMINDGSTGNRWGDALKAMLERNVSARSFNTFTAEAFIDLPDRTLSLFMALLILKALDHLQKGKNAAKTAAAALAVILGLSTTAALPPLKAEADDFSSDYETVTYSSRDGIFNSAVNAVTQTPDGFIWVGTYSGLYMYDGVRFEEADLHEDIKTVKALMVDSKGRLWIGTNESGVACFDFTDRSLMIYSTKNGLDSDSVRAVCEDTSGNIYVGTALSLSKITPQGKVKTYYEWRNIIHTQSLTALDSGGILGVTNGGTLFLAKDDMLLDEEVSGTDGIDFRVADRAGDMIYVGTSTAVVDKFSVKNEKITRAGRIDLASSEYCNKLKYDPKGNRMFYCCENGLGYIECDTDRTFDLTTEEYNGDISDVCIDDQNNLWFSSSKQGLMKFSKTPFVSLFNKVRLPARVVNATMKDGDMLYVGTDTGLYLIDMKNEYLVGTEATDLLGGDRIRHLYKDSKGNIWVATYGKHGLVRIAPNGICDCISDENEALSSMKFRSVTELSDGRILVATNMGLTFLRDGKPELSLSDADGLNNHYILSMLEREDGTILAASDGDGIYIIKNNKVAGHIGTEEGLDAAVILRIVKCTGGCLYVTSNALYYDNGSEIRKLHNFPYSNNYDILISDSGSCYITSSAGLFIVPEDKLLEDGEYSCTLLNDSWGLKTAFTANSWNVLEDGSLYLCCTDGVRVIDSENYGTLVSNYQLHLKYAEADGKLASFENGKWVIPSETRRVLLHIAVNNFSMTNPRVHYYLEGSEDDGITCYQNEITPLSFTNLPYGEYDLHICVLDDLTGKVLKEEIIPIEKEAVMYEFWYFKLYLIAVIVAVFLYLMWVFVTFNRRAMRIRRLQREISTDPMTGLLNKAGSINALEKACAEESGVLMMIDLDSFKLVNDIYGHGMGDRVLIRFAELITSALGEENIRGRMGGDEFVGFMKDGSEEEIERVTRQMNRELMASAKEYMGEDMNIPLGTSIGAVKVPADGKDFHELFKLADKALYAVKQNGKHGCSFYKKGSHTDTADDSDTADLSQVIKIISERNEGKGAYSVSFDKLQVIYKYLCRNSLVSPSAAAIVRFRLIPEGGITDELLDSFEDHLITGLKKNDVVSKHSGCFFVLLNGLSSDDAGKVAQRIADSWSSPIAEGVRVSFEFESIG